MPGGRPSIFTQEIADEICRRLANGETLIAICEEKDTPGIDTVRRWARDNPEFQAQYARARADQCDHFAEDMMRIADTEEDPNRARVRIDARKWFASKVAPKKYGDRVGIDHDGEVTIKIVKNWGEEPDNPCPQRQEG